MQKKKKHLHLSTVQNLRDEATEQLLIKSVYLYYFYFFPCLLMNKRNHPCGPGPVFILSYYSILI